MDRNTQFKMQMGKLVLNAPVVGGLVIALGLGFKGISNYKEEKHQAWLNTLTESINKGEITARLTILIDGKKRFVELQNPSAEDRLFLDGLRAGTAGGLNNVSINIGDSRGNTFCTIQTYPSALGKLINAAEADPKTFQSAGSIEDLAKICDIPPQDIKVKYFDMQHSLLEFSPYKLQGGAQHDPLYAKGYAPQIAKEKAAAGKIAKS